MFVHKVVPKNTQKEKSDAANSKLFVNIFLRLFQINGRIINTIASILPKNILVYLSLGIICSLKFTVFLKKFLEKLFDGL